MFPKPSMEKENKIRLLPEIVANQIAAGEVVDNPSSVVKEMMENAIDAGAKSVTVNFRNAGLELIQIIDDGCGMSPIDARMAFDRHATSKDNLAVILSYNPFMDSPLAHLPDSRTIVDAMSRRELGEGFNWSRENL